MNLLQKLMSMFRPAPPIELEPASELTPAIVDAAIAEAGPEKVFALARANGWVNGMNPPMWVWYRLACELQAANEPTPRVLN